MANYIYKKLSWFVIIFSFFSFTCNNNIVSSSESSSIPNQKFNSANEGLCIYATKVDINSNLTYQNFDIEEADLIGEPLVSYNQIISYDTSSHIITLSYSQDSLKNKIGQIGVYGKPFIVTLDSQKIYGGWFWTPISSIPCHSVVIEPDDVFDTLKTNEIRIKLGYPDENQFKGIDPRNNRVIIDRLIKDKKVK